MANTLLLKRSSVANSVPSTGNLALGELAINTFDGKLYTKIDDGSESIFELTQNQTITLSGDVSGSGISTITTVLANSGVIADTYGSASAIPSITVDAKGRITSATTFAIDTSAIANGTSNIAIPVANGNINMTVDGNTVVIITDTGANVDGTLNVTGNVAVANILTDGYFYANGAPIDFQQPAGSNTEIQFNSDGDFGASPAFTFDTAANVLTVGGNVDVSGNINADTLVGSANVTITAGSFTTNFDDSGNVTLPGNLAVTDAVVATGNVSGGNLTTAGDVTTSTVTASSTVTATGNVSGGNLTTAGAVDATGNVTGGNLVAVGDVSGATLTISGNIDGANLNATDAVTAGTTVTAVGNVSGGNIITTGDVDTATVTASGNVSGGNLTTAGDVTTATVTASSTVTATGNVSGGNLTTAGQVSATGNVSGGNLTTAGDVTTSTVTASSTVTATGNVSGGNLTTAGDVTTSTVTASSTVTATGNVSGGNLTTAGDVTTSTVTASSTVTATGNVSGGNLVTAGTVAATGNVSGGNLVTTGDISTVQGNISGGNLAIGNNVSVTGNVTADDQIITDTVAGRTGDLTISTSAGNILFAPSGNLIDMGGAEVHNVGTPTDASDAATKQYVDDAVSSGITIHTPVRLELPDSVGSLNATYAQGGNTYTVNETIAGNTVVFTTAANLQVNDQLWFSTSFQGIVANVAYFVVSAPNTSAAVLSTAYNGLPVSNITSASGLTESVRVNSGQGATLTNAGANAVLTIDGVAVNTSDRVLVYNQTNGYENGVYVVTVPGDAGNAWVLTRATDTDTYKPNDVTGLDAGDYFFVTAGDTGAGESYVMTAPTGPIILGYDDLTFTQFNSSQVYSAGTGLTLTGTTFSVNADQSQVTQVGTLIDLDVTGNANVGNLSTEIVTASGNVIGANLNTSGTVNATGNVNGGNLVTAGQTVATGNITGGNINTGGQVTATGNVNGGNLVTAGDVTTATVTASSTVTATGNVSGGNLTTAGDVTTATVTASGNIDGGNLTTAGQVVATGNITGGNMSVTGTTAATSTSTGAVVIAGGLGVAGNIYAGDIYKNGTIVLNADDTIDGGTY